MGRRLLPFALAGIAAPCLFTTLVVVQAVMQPDYGDLEMPISALAAWPAGWLQNLNFYLFGALNVVFAIGLHLGLRPTPRGVAGPALLVVSSVGAILAGLFPMTRSPDGALVEPISHIAAAVTTFLGVGAGYIVLSRRMRSDVHFTDAAGATRAVGVAIVTLFVAMGALAAPPGTPLHRWFGLLQRVILAAWFPWQIALAVRLLRTGNRSNRLPPA